MCMSTVQKRFQGALLGRCACILRCGAQGSAARVQCRRRGAVPCRVDAVRCDVVRRDVQSAGEGKMRSRRNVDWQILAQRKCALLCRGI